METLQKHSLLRPAAPRNGRSQGFTLIEVLVALCVMVIGLTALAALTAQMATGTESSRFMGLAAILATEKLEDLNRWPSSDPNVYAPAGGTSGSLTTDAPSASVTSGGVTQTVNYFDYVTIAATGGTGGTNPCVAGSGVGAIGETVGSAGSYTTTYHCADGELPTQVTNTTPTAADANAASFDRRWIIEDNPTINGTTVTGARRITVLVTLNNSYINPPPKFQLSMVRP